MMVSYKLTYGDRRTKGEVIRLLFHAAGVEFEDIRVSIPDEYNKLPLEKRKLFPILEVHGKMMCRSYAISRYLAREFGFAGRTSWEAGLIDKFMELTADLMDEMQKVFETEESKRTELYKEMIEVTQPVFMKIFDEAIQTNGGNYLVGDSLTVADLAVYNLFDSRVMEAPDALDSYPRLKANRKATESHPRIAAYLKNRKHTDV